MLPATLFTAILLTQTQAPRLPAFTPQLHVKMRAVAPRARTGPHDDAVPDIVCGMPMIRKSPADDPKMLLPRREPGAAIRRIEPACAGNAIGPAK